MKTPNLEGQNHNTLARIENINSQSYTDKKENKIFLMHKEIQRGSGAKSYKKKGFVIYEEIHKYFHNV
jgi:hypothetical protein